MSTFNTEIQVDPTTTAHRDVLAPVTLRCVTGSVRLVEYLTLDEARDLAGALHAAVDAVEREVKVAGEVKVAA